MDLKASAALLFSQLQSAPHPSLSVGEVTEAPALLNDGADSEAAADRSGGVRGGTTPACATNAHTIVEHDFMPMSTVA